MSITESSHFSRSVLGLIVGIASAAIGQGLSWQFPTAPSWLSGGSLILYGAAALVGVGMFRFGPQLFAKLPRWPWFPDNPLHGREWIKQRPSLSLIGMSPKEDREISGLVVDCRLTLTLYQAFDQLTDASFDYGPAVLEITQSTRGRRCRYHFRPVETGGLLSLRQSVRMKAVQIDFAWTGVPAWPNDSPNLSAAFEWKLSGARATVHRPQQMSGRLPSLRDYRPSAAEMLHTGAERDHSVQI